MNVLLANPSGFCAGVDRAIGIVETALDMFGAPIYVRHEVVHNKYVVECLRDKGAIFVEEIAEVPEKSIVIFSAHGVSQKVRNQAAQKQLKIFDATCPLVTKVHMEVTKFSETGHECILIGHAGHPEVEGTMGQYDSSSGGKMYLVENTVDVLNLDVKNPDNLAYVTQTTLSMDDTVKVIDALRSRFKNIKGPKKDDICYATQNRQDAVKQLANKCDVVLIVGSSNSSNSNRLREVAERLGTPAYLIDDETGLNQEWFKNKNSIGLAAGASAPCLLVENVIEKLQLWGATEIDQINGITERVVFSLPKELQQK
ncbi:MAG: 4-hydroxy-3-methylbut-2-enyl diphosphate reductase [Thiohalomonadales bacterium]